MPELPETETIARDLAAALRGTVVRSVRVAWHDVLRGVRAPRLVQLLEGARIAQVYRRAKSIVIQVTVATRHDVTQNLVVTPRFTGSLLVDATPDAYGCIRLTLADGRTLTYRDVRRLGTVSLLGARAFAAWETSLGPEPLDPDLTPAAFAAVLRRSRRAVKTILMDQRLLAGVGNIYANESCWRAGIRPARPGRALTHADCGVLLIALRAVLTESMALRGTTFRDYRDAHGERGGFAERLAVYGRAGLPCQRCGSILRSTHAIAGRATVWCAKCQR